VGLGQRLLFYGTGVFDRLLMMLLKGFSLGWYWLSGLLSTLHLVRLQFGCGALLDLLDLFLVEFRVIFFRLLNDILCKEYLFFRFRRLFLLNRLGNLAHRSRIYCSFD
jgi:hypothetical protein